MLDYPIDFIEYLSTNGVTRFGEILYEYRYMVYYCMISYFNCIYGNSPHY